VSYKQLPEGLIRTGSDPDELKAATRDDIGFEAVGAEIESGFRIG
jgi:hypothetical protein